MTPRADCPCGEPLPDARTICGRCEKQLRYHLRDQEEHRRELVIALTRLIRMNAPNDVSRGSSPGLMWQRMGDRYLDAIDPVELRAILVALPPARAAAEALHVQRRLLVAWCRKLRNIGGQYPEHPQVAAMAAHLEANLNRLHAHPEAGQLVAGARNLELQVIRAIDIPANRVRIKVGFCPERECTGIVEAIVPRDDDVSPTLRCSGCRTEWNSTQWTRVGARILRCSGTR